MSRSSKPCFAAHAFLRRKAGRLGRCRLAHARLHEAELLVGGFHLRLLTEEEDALLAVLRRCGAGGTVVAFLAESLQSWAVDDGSLSMEAVEAGIRKTCREAREKE